MDDKTRKYIDDLHAHTEMLLKAKVKPKVQCLLRWSATHMAVLSREAGE
jgi:hypothetical protein